MPLIQKKSKKAFEENMKTEMAAGKPKDQSLAIAYAVKRKPKKYAEGGSVSAKTEKRPMPDEAHDDSEQESKNSGDKSPKNDDWGSRITVKQSQKPSITKLSQPKIVGSDAFSVRNRYIHDEENDLETSKDPNEGPQRQPQERDNESDPKKRGTAPHPMKMMAKGGMINDDVSMRDAENDEDEDPSGLESDNDQMKPSEDEIMSNHFASGGNVDETDSELSSRPDKGWGAIIYKPGKAAGGMVESGSADMNYADGGEIDGGSEEEDAMHDSIAAAIMAKRDRKMASGGSVESGSADMNYADGGTVDINENAEESPNSYYKQNKAALKENYDSDTDDVSQPQDSNEHGDLHEEDEENMNDMISAIRRKIAMKRQFGSK